MGSIPQSFEVHEMLRSLAAAAGTLLALGAACGCLLAVGFGRASPGQRILVLSLRELAEYRSVRADVRVGSRSVATACVDGWRHGERSAVVAAPSLGRIVEVGGRLSRADAFDVTAFDLTGCPHALQRWLGGALARGSAVEVVSGRDAETTLRLRRADPPVDVTLGREELPMELTLRGRTLRGTSDLHYGRSGA